MKVQKLPCGWLVVCLVVSLLIGGWLRMDLCFSVIVVSVCVFCAAGRLGWVLAVGWVPVLGQLVGFAGMFVCFCCLVGLVGWVLLFGGRPLGMS